MLSERSWPRTIALAAVLLVVVLVRPAPGQAPVYPGASWARVPAEQAGWSEEKLKEARAYAGTIQTAAVMIVAGGLVVDEWGDTTKRFNIHSVRKSFLSALYGIHVREGHIQLSKTLADLGIDDRSPLTPLEKSATVSDLLKARSGVYHPALYETPGMAAARPARGSYAPGVFWYYNNWDFNALGTIFEQAIGASIYQEFKKRIAEPLDMEDFRLEDGAYVRGPESAHSAYPFRMRPATWPDSDCCTSAAVSGKGARSSRANGSKRARARTPTSVRRVATVTSGGWHRTVGHTSHRRTSRVACTRRVARAVTTSWSSPTSTSSSFIA